VGGVRQSAANKVAEALVSYVSAVFAAEHALFCLSFFPCSLACMRSRMPDYPVFAFVCLDTYFLGSCPW